MSSLSSYRKSLAVALTAVAHLIASLVTGDGMTETEVAGTLSLVVAAVMAYLFRNEPYPDPQNPDGL